MGAGADGGDEPAGAYGYTYPNPVWSPLESRLYLFWRGGSFLPTFSTSADEGESWQEAASQLPPILSVEVTEWR